MTTGTDTRGAASARRVVSRGSRITHDTRVGTIPVPVRPWPLAPHIAQLVLYQQSRQPTERMLHQWCDQLAVAGFTSVRTTALSDSTTRTFAEAGFQSAQELVLLQHTAPSVRRIRADAPIRRLTDEMLAEAAEVDIAAFEAGWQLDATAIADVCLATPRHRARAIAPSMSTSNQSTSPVAAYAVSGRDARQVFLQRLAVHPTARRQGLAVALVTDCLAWATRWRAERVMVNTHTTNTAALELYRSLGFERLAERLHVYERVLQ